MKLRTLIGGAAIIAVAAITIPVQKANATPYWGYYHRYHPHYHYVPRFVIVAPHRERHAEHHRDHDREYR